MRNSSSTSAENWVDHEQDIDWSQVGSGAKVRRCEEAKMRRSIGRAGERSRYMVIAELRPVENRDDKPQDGGVLGKRDLTLSGSAIEKCAII